MANKIKKLKLRPSSRDKRRYFLVKANSSKIENAILDYIGILGFAESAYLEVNASRGMKEWEEEERGYIIGSCLVKSLNKIRTALTLAGISIKKVSGTLKGLRGKA